MSFNNLVKFVVFLLSISSTLSCNPVDNLRRAVNENSNDLRNQMKASSTQVSKSIDTAVSESKEMLEELTKEANNLADKISNSISNVTGTISGDVKESVKIIAEAVEQIAKQVEFRVNTTDLIQAGEVISNNFVEAVDRLSTNWNLAVNTTDLKTIGSDAAEHLSKALQNLKIKFDVSIKFDATDNVVTIMLYLAVAITIAFSVCFIAIVLSIKQTRSCVCCGRQGNKEQEKDKRDAEIRYVEMQQHMPLFGYPHSKDNTYIPMKKRMYNYPQPPNNPPPVYGNIHPIGQHAAHHESEYYSNN